MMKKLLATVLSIVMVMSMSISAFAVSDAQARQAQYEIIETYNFLCEEYDQNEEMAMQELLRMYPSLAVVEETVTYFDEEGQEVLPTRSSMNDISLVGEMLIHDSDWDTYIYFGYWEWETGPDELNLQPYDVVGFYTQSSTEMYPLEYFVYGYNSSGDSEAYYNSLSGESSGYIVKGEDTVWGAAFWIDDRYICSGRMSVPIDYVEGSNKKVMLKYDHSWTSADISGIGGSVGIGSAGFNVSWDVGVNHWESPVTSAGVRLPE